MWGFAREIEEKEFQKTLKDAAESHIFTGFSNQFAHEPGNVNFDYSFPPITITKTIDTTNPIGVRRDGKEDAGNKNSTQKNADDQPFNQHLLRSKTRALQNEQNESSQSSSNRKYGDQKDQPQFNENDNIQNQNPQFSKTEFIQSYIENAFFEYQITKEQKKRPNQSDFTKQSYPAFFLEDNLITGIAEKDVPNKGSSNSENAQNALQRKSMKSRKGENQKPKEDGQIESHLFVIEKIIGCSSPLQDKNEKVKFYAKYGDAAYIHCEWLDKEEVLSHEGGAQSLQEFMKAKKSHPLIRSICIPNLLVLDNSELDPMWYKLERIIDESNDDDKFEYLVKWRGLDYEQNTWEGNNFVDSKNQVERYQERLKAPNNRKLPSRYKRPSKDQFKPITKLDTSSTGIVLKQEFIEPINHIVYNYFDDKNIIHCDRSPIQQRYQICVALDELTNQANFNGPILLLTNEQNMQIWKDQFEEWTGFNAIIFDQNKLSQKSIIETEFTVVDDNGRNVDSKIQADIIITSFEIFKNKHTHGLFTDIDFRVFIIDLAYHHPDISILDPHFRDIKSEFKILCLNEPVLSNVINNRDYFIFIAQNIFKKLDNASNEELCNIANPYVVEVHEIYQLSNYRMIEVDPSSQQIALATNLISKMTKFAKYSDYNALRHVLHILRLISDHPILYKYRQLSLENIINYSGKFVFLNKILSAKTAAKKKFLIFSEVPDCLDLVEILLSEYELQYMRVSAIDTDNQFDNIIDSFDESIEHNVLLFNSHNSARMIDTSIFDTIILLDDDTFKLRASPRAHIYHLVTRGFPDESLYCRNLCYDDSVKYVVSMDGPYPVPDKALYTIIMASMHKLKQISLSEINVFNNRTYDDIIRMSTRNNVGNRTIPITCQWNEYLTPTPYPSSIKELVASIHAIGIRGRPDVYQIIKIAYSFFNSITPFEKRVLKTALSKVAKLDQKPPDEYEFIKEQATAVVYDALLYLRLQRALYLVTEVGIFPDIELSFPSQTETKASHTTDSSSSSVSPMILQHYEILYTFYMGGSTYSITIIKHKNYSYTIRDIGELVQLVVSLLERIEKVYENDDPDFLDFVPMTPERYSIYYPEILKIREEAEIKYQEYLMMREGKIIEKDKPKEIEQESKPVIKKEETKTKEEQKPPQKEETEEQPKPSVNKEKKETTENYFTDYPLIQKTPLTIPQIVYNSVLENGIPLDNEDDKQWDDLIEKTKIKCDKKRLKKIVSEFINTSIQALGEHADIDLSQNTYLRQFGTKFSLDNAREFLSTVRIMSTIQSCVNHFKGDRSNLFKKIPEDSDMPEWWTSDHTKNLLTAISENGTCTFFKWIVDKKYNFYNNIPSSILESFQAAADIEESGNYLTQDNYPLELGDFAKLSNRKWRMNKCVTFSLNVTNAIFQKKKVNIPKNMQQSGTKYLLEPSEKLKIISFGQINKEPAFNSQYCPFPIGFISERQCRNRDGVTRWYRCEIEQQSSVPIFSVTLIKDPSLVFYGNTPREAWKNCEQYWKKDNSKIAGLWLFGLVNSHVLDVFSQMIKSKSWRALPDALKSKSQDDARLVLPEE